MARKTYGWFKVLEKQLFYLTKKGALYDGWIAFNDDTKTLDFILRKPVDKRLVKYQKNNGRLASYHVTERQVGRLENNPISSILKIILHSLYGYKKLLDNGSTIPGDPNDYIALDTFPLSLPQDNSKYKKKETPSGYLIPYGYMIIRPKTIQKTLG